MGYLEPGEYEAYGLASDTADEWIAAASALMEGYCRRPSLVATQYVERMRLVAGNRTVRLTYLPVVEGAVTGLRVRYGQARRGEYQEAWILALATAFALPGSWSTLDPTQVDLDAATGEVTMAANLLGLAYNEVEVTYTGGAATVPAGLKVACAQVVKNAQAMPALNVQRSRVDTLQMQYFSGDLLDASVRRLLAGYVAQKVG